jgi:hypothetical protein
VSGRRSGYADTGQAAVLALGVVAVAAAGVVGTGVLGGVANDAARARTAADAAALAGVMGGRAGAASLAAANGGVLIRLVERRIGSANEVIVTVRVGSAESTARATSAS